MRCEGGVAPGFFRSLYAPIERASGGVAVQASSAAAVTRSRSESSPRITPLPSFIFPTVSEFSDNDDRLILKESPGGQRSSSYPLAEAFYTVGALLQ